MSNITDPTLDNLIDAIKSLSTDPNFDLLIKYLKKACMASYMDVMNQSKESVVSHLQAIEGARLLVQGLIVLMDVLRDDNSSSENKASLESVKERMKSVFFFSMEEALFPKQ